MAAREPARAARLQRAWSTRSGLARWLLPVSWLYGALVRVRRWLYASQWFRTRHFPAPVIVIGNVVVGGAGKTPVTIAVIEHLQQSGWCPGLVSRGYGRLGQGLILAGSGEPDAHAFGDEPALISLRCSVPVAVAEKRTEAVEALLDHYPKVDVVVCDDGLQHLALARDIDICVWSASGAGNGWLLPAGPLREPWPRPVDLVLYAGETIPPGLAPAFGLRRRLADYAMTAQGESIALATLVHSEGSDKSQDVTPLVAVAGTAQPDEFFAMLRAIGIPLADTIALPDHFNFDSWTPSTDKRHRLICTEKDAVKLWPRFPDALAVRLELDIAPDFFTALDAQLAALPLKTARR